MIKQAKAMIPSVGYVRNSSDQQEASPAQQKAEIKKLASRDGYKIIRWYDGDIAISGDATKKRKDFQRMIRDAEEKGDFEAILCWDQDRFGRFDSIEAGRWIHPLREAQVYLVTIGQGKIDWKDFQSRLIYQVQQEAKHSFLVDLARNLVRSIASNVSADNFSPFVKCAPPGMCRVFYDAKGKEQARVGYRESFRMPKGWTCRLAPSDDEEEREAMRWAIETYADTTCSLAFICRGLEQRGVLSRTGTRIEGKNLRRLFGNKKYVGVQAIGKYANGKYYRLGSDCTVKPAHEVPSDKGTYERPEPIKEIEGFHEPLIDRRVFDRVQAKLAKLARHIRKASEDYVLTGLLYCGDCGARMHGRSAHVSPRHHYKYYSCEGGGSCRGFNIRQEVIEGFIAQFFENVLCTQATAELMAKLEKEVKAAVNRVQTGGDPAKELRKRITALDEKVRRGRLNFLEADKADVPAMRAMLADLREQRDAMKEQVACLRRDPGNNSALAAAAMRKLEGIRDTFASGNPLRMRLVLHDVFERITLHFEGRGRKKRLKTGVFAYRGTFCAQSPIARSMDDCAKERPPVSFAADDVLPGPAWQGSVAALRVLHKGRPVSTAQLCKRLSRSDRTVRRHMEEAVRNGSARRVWLTPAPNGARRCGWMPMDPSMTGADQMRLTAWQQSVAALSDLYKGKPVSTVVLSRKLSLRRSSIQRHMAEARRQGTVTYDYRHRGWIPASAS